MEININNFLENISKKYNIIFYTEFNDQILTIEYERYFILYSLNIFRREIEKDEKKWTIGLIEYFLEKMEKFESLDDRSSEENGILKQFEECNFELEEKNGELFLSEEDQKEIINLFENLEEDKKLALKQEQKNISDIEKMKNKLEELKRTN